MGLRTPHRVTGLAFGLLVPIAGLHAQQAPDAGTLLRDQPKPPPVVAPKPATPRIEAPAPGPAAQGPRILVKGLRITGNTLISEAELLAHVEADVVGKEFTLDELQRVAVALIGYYAQKGYLARVIVPPQEVRDGVVRFEVIEGRRGNLSIDRQGQRIDGDRVARFIEQRLPRGAPMDVATLSEAISIVNEQPGARTEASLAPGGGEREIDVTVHAADQPFATGSVFLNNQGSRSTGVTQLGGGVTIANPTGNFDAASVIVNLARGSAYGRIDYGLAVGDRGLRIGANASALEYELVQPAFAALQPEGTAQTIGLTASYPLSRRVASNLSIVGAFDHKRLVDRSNAGETGNRTVNVGNVGLDGYTVTNTAFVLSYGVSLVAGKASQHNAAALAADQAGRQTEGSFTKLAWNAGVLRGLDGTWTLGVTARGQFAGKNLDSSERFSLGGPTGVRGYPASEGTGDDGWIASVSVSRTLGERVTFAPFFDVGGVTVNHSQPAVGPANPNNYTLAAAGAAFQWRIGRQAAVNATIAIPVGSNAGAIAPGLNVDGTNRAPRAWVGASVLF